VYHNGYVATSPAAYTSFLSVYKKALVFIPCESLSTNYGTKSRAGLTPVAIINTSVGTYLSLSTTDTGLPLLDLMLLMLAEPITLTPFFSANFFNTPPTYFPTTFSKGTLA
jgi:hypothetical protein